MTLTTQSDEKTSDDEGGIIIAFRNKPKTPNKDLKRFCNQLYGYKYQSNKGKGNKPYPTRDIVIFAGLYCINHVKGNLPSTR